jgi:hypothetical protein
VLKKFRQDGVDSGRFGMEFEALILEQIVDQLPGNSRRNGMFAHHGLITKEPNQGQLNEPAQARLTCC